MNKYTYRGSVSQSARNAITRAFPFIGYNVKEVGETTVHQFSADVGKWDLVEKAISLIIEFYST